APAGDLTRVLEIPIDGGNSVRTLFTLTHQYINSMDVAADGSIFMDEQSMVEGLVRFSPAGGAIERITPESTQVPAIMAVLPDGRPLIYEPSGAKSRYMIVGKDGGLSPLVESSEDCTEPAAVLDARRVAVSTDKKPAEIAIVSIADGRIISRIRLAQNIVQ